MVIGARQAFLVSLPESSGASIPETSRETYSTKPRKRERWIASSPHAYPVDTPVRVATISPMAKTIYRKCPCGETAHDGRAEQVPVLLHGEPHSVWEYFHSCRNCGRRIAVRRDVLNAKPISAERFEAMGGAR